jgi:maltooligosyltrehalose trehalohydrolase
MHRRNAATCASAAAADSSACATANLDLTQCRRAYDAGSPAQLGAARMARRMHRVETGGLPIRQRAANRTDLRQMNRIEIPPDAAVTAKRAWRIGAQAAAGGVAFCVWAPHARTVTVVLESGKVPREVALDAQGDGFFARDVAGACAGDRYRFQLDGGPLLPDPASRFQPDGPHGASEVIDPCAFVWSDSGWPGLEPAGQVVYEMHIGTFTPEGTWAAATGMLPALAELGISVVEVMPVVEFAGAFGWGYDGVDLFAPHHHYGRPDDMRRFVDAAHGLGIGVIVDVVYNHFGPDGNYLREFAHEWISPRQSEWGDAPNFDGPRSRAVREFYAANAACWIDEFHADGLRLDATQQIIDHSDEHILGVIVRAARAAAGARHVYVIAESEPQDATVARPCAAGGHGCDALWNDDFHHAANVALRGRREAYYSDFAGSAQEIVSAVKYGFLYQGQHSPWQGKPRGHPAFDLPAHAFVQYLENHDQVANSLHGERLVMLVSPALLRAMTALLLLAPQTPLIFQGQEFASTRPFLYFADHPRELAAAVRRGRAQFLSQFPSIAGEAAARLADPADAATFHACKLDPAERTTAHGVQTLALFRDLIALRRNDPVFSGRGRVRVDGAVLAGEVFVIRFFGRDGDDRLLCTNLGVDFRQPALAEPLLAPPVAMRWRPVWCSEAQDYGGDDVPEFDAADGWALAAHSAIVLAPEPALDEQGAGDE